MARMGERRECTANSLTEEETRPLDGGKKIPSKEIASHTTAGPPSRRVAPLFVFPGGADGRSTTPSGARRRGHDVDHTGRSTPLPLRLHPVQFSRTDGAPSNDPSCMSRDTSSGDATQRATRFYPRLQAKKKLLWPTPPRPGTRIYFPRMRVCRMSPRRPLLHSPLNLMRPLPALQWTTATAVFLRPKVWTWWKEERRWRGGEGRDALVSGRVWAMKPMVFF